jgi:tetratricopeptide (TPR) repeat protein
MKKIFISIFFVLMLGTANAQEQTAKLLQETARTLVQKGDYDNAVLMLDRARKQEPDNVDLLRELVFANYLKRDFAQAIEVGKELVEKPNADQQSFQVLGLAYKAIASYKECAKLYRTALRRFPNSGVIYNEYGELSAMDNELEEAIVQWEKGIELDPGYSSNYYNATMYYSNGKNWLRAALYGELFLNLESYSTRTEEIKSKLYKIWATLLSPGYLLQAAEQKNLSAFEKAVYNTLGKAAAGAKDGAMMNQLAAVRTGFLLQWMQGNQKTWPYRLFDHQQYLVSQGLFEAYNYWLFGNSLGGEAYAGWQKTHTKETEGFRNFQQSRVFKIPAGEYYFSR